MKSGDDRPSLWDLRSCLLSSLDFAEDFARNRPEHAAAVASFSQDIRRIKSELMSSFEESSAESSLHDIVTGLSGARAMASIMAEHHPEKSQPLEGFARALAHTQKNFIRSVQPNLTSE
jgi:hypothetical protein